MQQTEKHGFNLIEKEDAFSPEPLNENTKKMEEVFGTCTAYMGTYVGDGTSSRAVELGFAPKLLFLAGGRPSITMRGWSIFFLYNKYYSDSVSLTDTGFHLSSDTHNAKDSTYRYVAFS